MMKPGPLRVALLAFVGLAAAACASSGGGGAADTTMQPAGNTVTIRVTNDMIPPTPITVWIAPETGSRRRLGTIEPSRQGTFTFTPGIRSMDHRLVAEPSTGNDVTTTPFTLEGVTVVRWTTSSTVVTLERGGE